MYLEQNISDYKKIPLQPPQPVRVSIYNEGSVPEPFIFQVKIIAESSLILEKQFKLQFHEHHVTTDR